MSILHNNDTSWHFNPGTECMNFIELNEYHNVENNRRFIPDNHTTSPTTNIIKHSIGIRERRNLNSSVITRETYEIIMPRTGDVGTLSGIRIKNAFLDNINDNNSSNNASRPTLLTSCVFDIKKLTLKLGNNVIKELDIDFIDNIISFKKRIDNDLYLDITHSKLLENINLCSIIYHCVQINVEFQVNHHRLQFLPLDVSRTNIDTEYMFNYNFIGDMFVRNDMIVQQSHMLISNFKSGTLLNISAEDTPENIDDYIHLNTTYAFNGLFFSGIPISDLKSICIYRNISTNAIHPPIIELLDTFHIKLFTRIFDKDTGTFYLPMCGNDVFDMINENSFVIGDQDSYNGILIKVKTHSNIHYDFKLGVYVNQLFLMQNGMGSLNVAHNFQCSIKTRMQIDTERHEYITEQINIDERMNNQINVVNRNNVGTSDNPTLEWVHMAKKINNPDEMLCCIMLLDINDNDNYIQCKECTKNFTEAVCVWIEEHKNCPHCRQVWSFDNYIIYENR